MSDLPESDPARFHPIIDHESGSNREEAGREQEPVNVPAPPASPGVDKPRAEPPLSATRADPVRRGGTPFAITLLFTAALAGGIYWTWTHPREQTPQADPQQAIDAARTALEQEIAAVDSRVARLEPIEARVGKLESTPSAPAAAAAPEAAPDQGAVSDLGKRIDDLSQHLHALAQQQDEQNAAIQKLAQAASAAPQAAPAPAAPAQNDDALNAARQQVVDLGQKLDQSLSQEKSALDELGGRLQKLEQSRGEQEAAQANAQAIVSLNSRIKALEQDQGQLASVSHDATLAMKLAAAQAALASGQPLGDLPGAPPALVRYAKADPPTEAELKDEYPAVSAKALAASRPVDQQHAFLGRVLARIEQSVTVRQGDHVIVGDPAAGVLARAQHALDDDDLAGAVHDLGALSGAAADAVKPWKAKAQSLLDARAALAQMAHS